MSWLSTNLGLKRLFPFPAMSGIMVRMPSTEVRLQRETTHPVEKACLFKVAVLTTQTTSEEQDQRATFLLGYCDRLTSGAM